MLPLFSLSLAAFLSHFSAAFCSFSFVLSSFRFLLSRRSQVIFIRWTLNSYWGSFPGFSFRHKSRKTGGKSRPGEARRSAVAFQLQLPPAGVQLRNRKRLVISASLSHSVCLSFTHYICLSLCRYISLSLYLVSASAFTSLQIAARTESFSFCGDTKNTKFFERWKCCSFKISKSHTHTLSHTSTICHSVRHDLVACLSRFSPFGFVFVYPVLFSHFAQSPATLTALPTALSTALPTALSAALLLHNWRAAIARPEVLGGISV